MTIKCAAKEDISAIAAVEAECFPAAEAATEAEFVERVNAYGNHFWLLFDAEKLIAFVDGFVTDEPDLTDEMYENAAMHNENGAWQMIFGATHCRITASTDTPGSCSAVPLLMQSSRGARGLY